MKKPENIRILSAAFFLLLALSVFKDPAAAVEGEPLPSYPYQYELAGKQTATAIAVDPAGFIIIAGSTQNATQDFLTVKVTADGSDKLWETTYDMNGDSDEVNAVAVDSYGHVIVVGQASNGSNNDIHTIKYNGANGTIIWQATYDGGGDDSPLAITVDSLDNIYIAGKTQGPNADYDGLLLKYSTNGANPNGTPIWVNTYDGPGTNPTRNDEWAHVAVGTAGVAVTGKTDISIDANPANFNLVTMVYNMDGTDGWAGGPVLYDSGNDGDTGKYVAMDSSDNVIVTAISGSNSGDIYTVKYNSGDGSLDWPAAITYNGGLQDEPMGLFVDDNDDVYITGKTFLGASFDYYTTRYNGANGNLVWGGASIYDSGSDQADIPVAIVVDNTGDVFVTGYTIISITDYDFTTIKYGKDTGTKLWNNPAGIHTGTAGKTARPMGIGLADNGELFIGGWTNTATNDYDFLAIKYDPGNLNVPTDLAATTVSDTAIDLVWSQNSTNEDGFKIYRKKASDQVFTYLNTVGANVTTYNDTGLTPHIWYEYKVQAYITGPPAMVSHYSNVASALSTAISYIEPSLSYQYNSDGNGTDTAYAIAVGPDEDPVATGSHQPGASLDYYTVKLARTDLSNTWDATYDDSSNKLNVASSITVDTNNDVIISGVSNLSVNMAPNTNDIYTRKYLAIGPDDGPPNYGTAYVWTDQFNGPGLDDDRAVSIDSSVDGNNTSVVTGYGKNGSGNYDIYVIKYDAPGVDEIGTKIWTATPYDGGGDDYPVAVSFDMNGDVLITGKTYLSGNYDVFTRKINGSTGATIWTAIFNGTADGWDEARGMALDSNGDVYVVASSINASGDDDWVILKYDGDALGPNGTIVPGWPIIYDGPAANGDDIPEAIKVDQNDDAVVVSGTVLQSAGNNDFHIRRYLADGTLDWARTLERASNDDNAVTMGMDVSGNVCVAGNTDDIDGESINLLAVKYDSAGNILGGTLHDDVDDSDAHAIAVNSLGDQFIAGYTTPRLNQDADFLVVKCVGDVFLSPSPMTTTVHYTSVDFDWVSTNTPDEDGFYLERKLGTCASVDWDTGNNQILSAAAGVESYTDEGLNIGSTYCYRLQAYKTSGATSRWLEKEVTTTIPTPPSDLVATVVNTTDIKLDWTDTTSTESGFTLVRCTGTGCDLDTDPERTTFDVAAGAQTYTDTTCCPGETYSYQIQAYRDTIGNWETAFVTFAADQTTYGLAPPTALIITDFAQTTVSLEWDDNSNDETSFVIERCTGTAAECGDTKTFADLPTKVTTIYGNVLLLGMNEASWNTTPNQVLDDSGNGNHATSAGDANTGVDGVYDKRGELDGTGDYVTTSLEIDQSTSSAGATMMAWVYPSTTSADNHYLFSTEDGSAGSENFNWGLLRNGATWYVDTGSGSTSTGIAVTEDQWQHIAIVFDPAGIRFYKNGVETAMAVPGNNDTSQAFTIGKRGKMNQDYFDGYLDEVAVYDRPLTLAQINTLMNDSVFESGKARYEDTTVSYNEYYTYQIRAEKSVDLSCTWNPAKTNEIEINTLPPKPTDFVATAVDSTTVIVDWTDNTAGEDNFTLERCVAASCIYADVTTTIAANTKTYTDNSACGGTTYNYRIKATDAVWTATAPSAVAVTTTGAEGIDPTGLTITDISEEQADLEWNYLTTDLTEFKVGACSGTCVVEGDYTVTNASPLPSDILARWQFDEPDWKNGRPVLDSSGNGYHATAKNEVAHQTPGKFGYGAGEFDGNDDYITTPLNIDQSGSSSRITMEAWVYPTSTSNTYKHIISTEDANSVENWGIAQYGSNWYFWTGNTAITEPITLNDWNHLVVVYDPSASPPVKAYKDGVSAGTYPYIYYRTTDANVTIGRRAYADDQYFQGKIDEVIIYNRALSLAEVQDRAWNRTRHTITGLTPNTPYNFRVWPYKDTNGGCDWDGPFTNVFTEVPESTDDIATMAPTSFTHSGGDTTHVNLSWDDISTSETGYRVQRCDNNLATCTGDFQYGVNDWLIAVPGATSFSDSTVCEGGVGTYTYRVQADKTDGPVWQSAWAYLEVTPTAATAPSITVSAASESEINVSWSDTNADEEQLILKRCDDVAANCTLDAHFTTPLLTVNSLEGKLLHYRMDEDGPLAPWNNEANDVDDISGKANHGRPYNNLTTGTESQYDRAGDFDGSSKYIYSNLNINQDNSSAPGVTMEAWVRPTLNDANYRYIFSTDEGGYDWGVLIRSNVFYIVNGASIYSTSVPVTLNDWQHIAAVFDPAANNVTFYKDGTETPFTYAALSYDATDYNFTIGRRGGYTAATEYFQGQIDEVVVYDHPLTQEEIADHAAQQVDQATFTDSNLTPGQDYTYRLQAKKYSPCPWTTESKDSDQTTEPPPPTDLTVGGDTTKAALTWTNNSGSLNRYVLQRCTGDGVACNPAAADAAAEWGTEWVLAAEAESYDDTTVCPGETFSYRVRAEQDPNWVTAWDSLLGKLIPTPTAPNNFALVKISEVQNNLTWDVGATTDQTGFTIERCAGVSCPGTGTITDIPITANATSYPDTELTPDTHYTYKIRAEKTGALCGWPTAYTDPPLSTDATAFVPTTLTGTSADTTSISMSWTDNTASETDFVIMRCDDPPDCAGGYLEVGRVGPGITSFTDTTACNNQDYKYQVKAIGSGLSTSGGDCWTKRALITFTNGFQANSAVEIVIPYAANMQADFDDIRFYDATAKQELTTYWFANKVTSDTATVWLMTGDNDNIYLYYGNPSAADSSSTTKTPFIGFSDDFTGGSIDAAKWTEIDVAGDRVRISNTDLYFDAVDTSVRDWNKGVISAQTFERAAGNEIYIDLSTAGTRRSYGYSVFGWGKDQTTNPNPTAANNMKHGLYFYGSTWGISHFRVIENGVATIIPGATNYYEQSTGYEAKIVLKDESGAQYFVKGGLYPDWTMIYESSTSYAEDDLLRVSMQHHSQYMLIHSVKVTHASAQRGPNIGAPEGDGAACLSGFNTWESGYNDNGPVPLSTNNFSDPDTLALVEASDTSVDISWNSNTTDESGFKIEHCVDTGSGCTFTQFDTTLTGITTYSDTTLPPFATVSYRVKAYKSTSDCDWTSGPSNVLSVALAGTAPTGPPADDIGFLTATALNSFKIQLDWVDNAPDGDGHEIEVQVFNGAYSRVATVAPGVETYTDSIGINPGTTYNYRIRSYRGAVKSTWLTGSVTTPAWSEGDPTSTCP